MAARTGAQHRINYGRGDLSGEAARLSSGEGTSVVVKGAGPPHTFRQGMEAVCDSGPVVYVCYARAEIYYDTTAFVRKELRVSPAVIGMLEARLRPFEELITRIYPVGQTGEAVEGWRTAQVHVARMRSYMIRRWWTSSRSSPPRHGQAAS